MNFLLNTLLNNPAPDSPFPTNPRLVDATSLTDPESKKAGKQAPPADMPLKPLTPEQDRIGQAATWEILNAVKNNTPYKLSEGAVKSGIDPSLTCIGGACNLYKNLGVDFSNVGDDKSGVRESRTGGKVVEYNPTFAKNYDKAGFELMKGRSMSSDELNELIKSGYLHGGDMVQYINEKGVPEHTNVVYNVNQDGSYKVYNAFKHSTVNERDSTDPYVYDLNPNADAFKNKKFNVYRISPDKAKELMENDKGKGAISEATANASLNDEFAKMREQKVIPELKSMDKGELKTYFGFSNFKEIPKEEIDKITLDRMRGDYGQMLDMNRILRLKNSDGTPITEETAKNTLRGYQQKYNRITNGNDWGNNVEYYQYQNFKKKTGKK